MDPVDADESLIVNVSAVVPALPSVTLASLTVNCGKVVVALSLTFFWEEGEKEESDWSL